MKDSATNINDIHIDNEDIFSAKPRVKKFILLYFANRNNKRWGGGDISSH
jgi:hypothetical protein